VKIIINCCAKTDTANLLYFLRTAKFSQLQARTLVENYANAVTNLPEWYRDIDTHDPALIEAIDVGLVVLTQTVSTNDVGEIV